MLRRLEHQGRIRSAKRTLGIVAWHTATRDWIGFQNHRALFLELVEKDQPRTFTPVARAHFRPLCRRQGWSYGQRSKLMNGRMAALEEQVGQILRLLLETSPLTSREKPTPKTHRPKLKAQGSIPCPHSVLQTLKRMRVCHRKTDFAFNKYLRWSIL